MSGNYHQKPMYEIVPSGDYLHVVCVNCRESCELDYKGRDPSMVLIEITCKNCGSSGKWKLQDAGMGFGEAWKPDSKAGSYGTDDRLEGI